MSYRKLLILGFSCIILVSGCCRDCLITNRELSSFKRFNDNNDDIVKIGSGWKFAEFIMNDNQGIRAYSIENNNILNSTYSQSVFETYINDEKNRWNKVNFKALENNVLNSNEVVYTDSNSETSSKISNIRRIKMNLDNGDLFISKEIVNDGLSQIKVKQNDILNLKNGGYLLIPLSILSKMKEGWKFTGIKNKKFIKNNILKTDNWLIIHAISGVEVEVDSNSGWFAYFYNNMLFIKKYSSEDSQGKRFDTRIKLNISEKGMIIKADGIERTVLPEKSSSVIQHWSIVEIKKEIKDLFEAETFYKDIEFKLKLLVERKDIY